MTDTCGIDVSKATLDAALRLGSRFQLRQFSNDASGFEELMAWASQAQVFVMEATGPYHKALLRELRNQGRRAVCLNPQRSRNLALGLGVLDKDDKVDARVLAIAACMMDPQQAPKPPRLKEEVTEISRRIEQLKDELAIERTRLKEPRLSKSVESSLRRSVERLVEEVERLELEWRELALSDPELAESYRLVLSVPQIGPITARVLVSELPSKQHLQARRKVVGLAGLAPRRRRSGTSLHAPDRISRCCNTRLKKSLYMPAIQALRRSQELRDFYLRLTAAGKHPKQAIAAVMRKIFTRAIAVLSRGEPWKPILQA